jgi:hypothetical protein
VFKWRKIVCLMLACIFPALLMSQDSGGAILRSSSKGGVVLNGNPAPVSSAIFKNDLVQTDAQSIAKIDATGSTVDVQPETLLQFEVDELVLQHGTLLVSTSTALKVRVGCVTVTPITMDWTQYDVTDVDGKVTVVAHKNDVKVQSRGLHLEKTRQGARGEEIVHAGEQTTREDKCGGAEPSPAHAIGAALNSPRVILPAAGAIIAGTLCWILCFNNQPPSPSDPR